MSNPKFTAPNYTTQDAATYKANIDAACASNGADSINIGFSYDVGTGTFTVHGSDGTALSATNPGFVRFQNRTTGGCYLYTSVEANQSFIDDNGASEIIGNLFGVTTGIAWAEDCPFYLYAMHSDNEASVAFAICRVPTLVVAPADSSIGAPDDPVADTQGALFSFDNIDETLYDGNPVTCLGSFRMRMSASDDWTVQSLTAQDGIGKFQEGIVFIMPQNQNGAAVGSHFLSSGGTAPQSGSEASSYTIDRSGSVSYKVALSTVSNTPSGAVSLKAALPLTTNGSFWGVGRFYDYSATAWHATTNVASGVTTLTYGAGLSTEFRNASIGTNDQLNIDIIYTCSTT